MDERGVLTQVKNLIYNMLEPDTQRRYLVDQVLASSWLAMDPRLAATTPAEETALAAARVERDRWLKKVSRIMAVRASVQQVNIAHSFCVILCYACMQNEADPTALALSSARPPPGGPSEMVSPSHLARTLLHRMRRKILFVAKLNLPLVGKHGYIRF